MKYEIKRSIIGYEEWVVEAIGSHGEVYVAIFAGPDAEQRAREYAALRAENEALRKELQTLVYGWAAKPSEPAAQEDVARWDWEFSDAMARAGRRLSTPADATHEQVNQ